MRAWMLLAVVGCGRISFDARPESDAPIADAPPDAREPPCPPLPGVLFCESFEGARQLIGGAGMVDVRDDRAFRGTRAQLAQTTGLSEASWQLGTVLPSIVTGDLYARWYLYIPSSVAQVHAASVHLVDMNAPNHGVVYGFRDGVAEVSSSEANVTSFSTATIARDRWVCAQMHVAIANTGGSIDGALDGQPIPPITNIDTLPDGPYRNVHVGLYATSLATGPMEMWSDEVAVGTLPIPCD